MLSDEEREAIKHLTEKMKYHKDNPLGTYVWLTLDEHYVRIILNLIEKQSKEIEELNKSDESKEQSSMKYYNLYKELVDKIKAKIEEYDDKGMTVNLANRSAGKTFQQAVHYEVKKVLQSLLEKE